MKNAKANKRRWVKPIVQDDHAGMEVTSYASASMRTP
jgi:coenzyme PQQ precursor peptide PqqA